MNYKKIVVVCIVSLVLLTGVLSGCGGHNGTLKDGYYTAEMAEYASGWKEFVTIHVENGIIASVEYNAKNASGYIKSWDMAYMRRMNAAKGTYPNYYTRAYARQVVEKQSAEGIETVAGASLSGGKFRLMVEAAIESAKNGKTEVAIVQES